MKGLAMNLIKDVADFHQQVLQQPPQPCAILERIDAMDRLLFMYEELTEFDNALLKEDMVGMADALADLVYVAIGTAYMLGLPFQEIWNAVQKANMAKVAGTTKRKMRVDAMKPAGWVGPEAEILKAIQNAIAPK
jgi:NTP pyrophosphatase (non-canonical NTP hydrolase)